MKNRKGFTLMEVLLYAGLLAITGGLLTSVLTGTVRVRTREANSTELAQQLNFVLGTVQSLVNESANVESVYEGADSGVACSQFCTLNLRMTATSTDPTIVSSDVNGIYLKQGTGATTTLTGAGVTVDHFELTKFEFEGGHASVRVDMALTIDSARPQFAVTRSIQSAIGRVTAAVFDDHLLPNANNAYDVGQASYNWRNGVFAGNLTAAGNVGIGTAAPGYALDVQSGGSVGVTHATNPYITLLKTAATARTWLLQAVGDNLALNLSGNQATGINIDYTGQVGVGTTTPAYKLDVQGTGRYTGAVSVATPVADSDAATKAYVDAAGGGGFSTCYLYADSTNATCDAGYTTLLSTSGTGCAVTTGADRTYAVNNELYDVYSTAGNEYARVTECYYHSGYGTLKCTQENVPGISSYCQRQTSPYTLYASTVMLCCI